MLLFTPCAIVLLPIFWKAVQIYGIFKIYLGIRVRKLQKFILTLADGILGELKALWILEADENSKKLLQFGASPKLCINEVLRKTCQFGSINEVFRLF